MSAVTSIAISGLQAAVRRLEVSAANVVNARSSGSMTPADARLATSAYQPRKVLQSSIAAGGVRSRVVTVEPGTMAAFDPDHPLADAEGYVAMPAVDLAQEFVEQIMAEVAYKAGLKLIETDRDMQKTLLDMKS
jgi:flagellar basal-body rod protein FlgC